MKKTKHIAARPKRNLSDISFYRDVIRLFKLSRKLKIDYSHNMYSIKSSLHIKLLSSHFSERLLQLPIAIAELETTSDTIKKVRLQLSIRKTFSSIWTYGTILKKQSSLQENESKKFEECLNSLNYSYREWVTSLTCPN